jgi:predicted transcriptional regulator
MAHLVRAAAKPFNLDESVATRIDRAAVRLNQPAHRIRRWWYRITNYITAQDWINSMHAVWLLEQQDGHRRLTDEQRWLLAAAASVGEEISSPFSHGAAESAKWKETRKA